MRIASGVTDQYIYFVAKDPFTGARLTGLGTFTVYRSRNGGAAAAYTTPTVNETDTTNMPGVYELLLDEDMTIDSGDETQEVALHITQASMEPVTRVFELYRPKITAGETLTVASGIGQASVQSIANNAITAASIAADAITDAKVASDVTIASVTGAVGSVTGNVGGNVVGSIGSVATGGITAGSIAADAIGASELAADAVAEIQSGLATSAALATLQTTANAIDAKTTNLPSDPADASVIAGRFDTLDTSVADLPTNAELATALASADDAVLAQIALVKAKTDGLTFTVAGQLDANIQYVNDVQVTGNGQAGTEWGP